MSWRAVQVDILSTVVADAGPRFATKDISEDERTRQAHPDLLAHTHYHSFVGRALSVHRVLLGIDECKKATLRGSLWERVHESPARERGTSAASPEPVSAGARTGISLGPQSPSDSPLAARMRRHQSWYRANVLQVPCGTGPTASSPREYGNMLRQRDGEAGRNFITPEIADIARKRVAQGTGAVEPFRLFNNMLSSQPMCFNLFGPLVTNAELATRLINRIVPENVTDVGLVALEWAPEPADEYLGDSTAFDAYVEYSTADGRRCALGVETKLTEPFSQKVYDGEKYRRWMDTPDAPWKPGARDRVQAMAHNQLWRDHLLAVAVRRHPRPSVDVARLLVVHHPQDQGCERVLNGYRKLLRDDQDSLLSLTLEALIAAWSTALDDANHRRWLDDFSLRYLELDKSAGVQDQA